MRPVLSEPAQKWLRAAEDGLTRHTLRLQDLPLEIAAFYHLGYHDARQLAAAEIQRLERDLNYWHHIATTTEQQRNQQILDRLHNGLAEADAETWDRLEADLRLAAALGTTPLLERRAA